MSFEDSISAATEASGNGVTVDSLRWRGQCVDHYAQIEFLIGTALRDLWNSGHNVPSQPLFTYRTKIAALRDAVGEAGFYAYKGLHSTLDRLHSACDQRNLIVHSSGAVSETPAGDWVWTGCYIPAEREFDLVSRAITQPEAFNLETELRRTIQSLKSRLSHLKTKVVTE